MSKARKAEIQFACTLHSTVTLDELQDQMKASNTMLMKLASIIEFQSEREKSWEQTALSYGGPKYILNRPEALQTVANIIEARIPDTKSTTVPSNKPGGPPGSKPSADLAEGGAPPKSKDVYLGAKLKVAKDEPQFTRRELLEVQRPLTEILDESALYFERKLNAQVQFLAGQIERSTQRILHRLDGGSWLKIQDPDLRTVWKDNVRGRTCLTEIGAELLPLYS